MQRNHGVASVIFTARQAHVSNNADQAPARYKRIEAALPDTGDFANELFVILNMPELSLGITIGLERPVWRRCKNQVDCAVCCLLKFPGIAEDQLVPGRNKPGGAADRVHQPVVPSDCRNRGLRLWQTREFIRQVSGKVHRTVNAF